MARGNGGTLTGDAKRCIEILQDPRTKEKERRIAAGRLSRMGIVNVGKLRPVSAAEDAVTKSITQRIAPTIAIPREGISHEDTKLFVHLPGTRLEPGHETARFRRAKTPANRALAILTNTAVLEAVLQSMRYNKSAPSTAEDADRLLAITKVADTLRKTTPEFSDEGSDGSSSTIEVLPNDSALLIGRVVSRYGRAFMIERGGRHASVQQTITLESRHWFMAPGLFDIVGLPEADERGRHILDTQTTQDIPDLFPDFVEAGGGFVGSALSVRQSVTIGAPATGIRS